MWGEAWGGAPWGAIVDPPAAAVEGVAGGEVLDCPGRAVTLAASTRDMVLQAPARAVLLEVT
jgi:hypothetical protein